MCFAKGMMVSFVEVSMASCWGVLSLLFLRDVEGFCWSRVVMISCFFPEVSCSLGFRVMAR